MWLVEMPFLTANFQWRFAQKEKGEIFMKEMQSAGRKKDQKKKELRRAAGRPKRAWGTCMRQAPGVLSIPLDLFLLFGNPARFYSQWTEPECLLKVQAIRTKAGSSWLPWHFISLPIGQAKSSSWCRRGAWRSNHSDAQPCLLLWMTFAVRVKQSKHDG